MGGVSSKSNVLELSSRKSLHRSEAEIVRLMYPIFYTPAHITASERERALQSWQLILDDKSPVFLENLGKPDFPYTSCAMFFYDSFYTRLFDIHPMCRQLFKNGMRSQGKFLVKMISLSLSELDDPAKFDKSLVKLAEIHYERGVKAVEYGIVGEVLFWALRRCLGISVYTVRVHAIWIKIYSRMLTTIVPVAISLELKTGNSKGQEERLMPSNLQELFRFAGNRYKEKRVHPTDSDTDKDVDSLRKTVSITMTPVLPYWDSMRESSGKAFLFDQQ